MKKNMMSLLVALAVGAFVTTAWACPGDEKSGCTKVQTVADAAHPGCGAAKATTVADAEHPGCGAAKAKTVADAGGSGCGKQAQVAGAKSCGESCAKGCSGDCVGCPGECGKSCCGAGGKNVQTVSGKSCGESCAKGCGESCSKSCDKPCAAKSATMTADKGSHGGCSAGKNAREAEIDAVLATLPSMTYVVGDEVMHCGQRAQAVAEKNGQPIRYRVGESTFDSKGDAAVALAALLENELDHLKTVQYVADGGTYDCPKTARTVADRNGGKLAYRVAGCDFDSKDKAESVAHLVSDKLNEIKMQYKVGDQVFCCDKMAGATAAKTGKPVHYLVNGEEIECAQSAKLKLAETLVRAAVSTAASAHSS